MKTQYIIKDFDSKLYVSKYSHDDIMNSPPDYLHIKDPWMMKGHARNFDTKQGAIDHLKTMHIPSYITSVQIIEVITL
jgi:hypothetical protein